MFIFWLWNKVSRNIVGYLLLFANLFFLALFTFALSQLLGSVILSIINHKQNATIAISVIGSSVGILIFLLMISEYSIIDFNIKKDFKIIRKLKLIGMTKTKIKLWQFIEVLILFSIAECLAYWPSNLLAQSLLNFYHKNDLVDHTITLYFNWYIPLIALGTSFLIILMPLILISISNAKLGITKFANKSINVKKIIKFTLGLISLGGAQALFFINFKNPAASIGFIFNGIMLAIIALALLNEFILKLAAKILYVLGFYSITIKNLAMILQKYYQEFTPLALITSSLLLTIFYSYNTAFFQNKISIVSSVNTYNLIRFIIYLEIVITLVTLFNVAYMIRFFQDSFIKKQKLIGFSSLNIVCQFVVVFITLFIIYYLYSLVISITCNLGYSLSYLNEIYLFITFKEVSLIMGLIFLGYGIISAFISSIFEVWSKKDYFFGSSSKKYIENK